MIAMRKIKSAILEAVPDALLYPEPAFNEVVHKALGGVLGS